VSTLVEIQNAIDRLRPDEKSALQLWFHSQAQTEMSDADERRLLASLDEATRDLDAGKGIPLAEVAKMVPSWLTK
jgi:hypothetical protein